MRPARRPARARPCDTRCQEQLALAEFKKRFASWPNAPTGAPPPAGIGAMIELRGDGAVVRELAPGGAGATGGLLVGDRLLAANGEGLEGLRLDQIIARLRGEPGTELEVARQGRPVKLKLRRAVAPVK